jgi:hypothetical protein
LLFPNTKPEPGEHLQEQHNQKHDALAHYLIKEDGHLYRQLTVAEKERGRVDARRVVCDSEIFDTIREWHLQLGHAGVNKVSKAVIERFYGIRKDDVEWVLKHCQTCLLERQNRSQTPARASREPVVSGRTLERVEIDLIDFRHEPDGEYKWILQIKDHFSKFTSFFPLKNQWPDPEEVAVAIAQWIGMFGHPELLLCDKNQEFKDVLLVALKEHGIKVVNGRPTTAHVQGSVEQAVEVKMRQWKANIELAGFGTKKWALSLPRVALAMNQQQHSGLGQKSPYEVFFNRKPRREIETRLEDIPTEQDPKCNAGVDAGEDRSIPFLSGEGEYEDVVGPELGTGHSSSQRADPTNETSTARQLGNSSPLVPPVILPSPRPLASRPISLGPPPPIPPRPRDLFPNHQPPRPLPLRRQPDSDMEPPLSQQPSDSEPQPPPSQQPPASNAVSSRLPPDSNPGPLDPTSHQPSDPHPQPQQPVSSQQPLGSEPVLPQQPDPTEQTSQQGTAEKEIIGEGRRGRKRARKEGPPSERVLRKRVRGG